MSAVDYSKSSAEEQMKNGELTPEQVMQLLKLDSKKYMIKKDSRGDAVNAAKKKIKNVQINQYVLYEKENGKWVKKNWNKEFFDNKGLNNYAIYGKNGIVIIKPFSFAKKEKNMQVGNPSLAASSDSNGTLDNAEYSSDGLYEASMAASWFEPKAYRGNDEKLIKYVSFTKLCLLKECYESLGILL